LFCVLLGMVRNADAERSVSSSLPSPAFRIAFGGRCDKSPVPCNRIDYFSAYVHVADVLLLPATDERGFGATLGYGASMALFHRLEIGIGGVLSACVGNEATQRLPAQLAQTPSFHPKNKAKPWAAWEPVW